MRPKIGILSALAVLALGFAAVTGVTHAQYPPPTGGISIESAATALETGETTTLTCTIVGPDGAPVPSTPCTFTIVSQPGDDAAVGSTTITKLTNSRGIATTELYAGSTPGLIIVEVESAGFVSSVLVTVDGEGEGDSPAPPQAPIGGIQPPSTGDGGLLGN